MKIITLFACLIISISSRAQNMEEDKVKEGVLFLFEGMRKADSAMVHTAFTDEAQMYTVTTNKEGKSVLHKGSLERFLAAVGAPHDQVWNERVWDMQIQIDGNLAQVWTQYAFYLDNQFSHCGVDAFQLFKSSHGWKIFQITDTRKKENCQIPADIKAAHK